MTRLLASHHSSTPKLIFLPLVLCCGHRSLELQSTDKDDSEGSRFVSNKSQKPAHVKKDEAHEINLLESEDFYPSWTAECEEVSLNSNPTAMRRFRWLVSPLCTEKNLIHQWNQLMFKWCINSQLSMAHSCKMVLFSISHHSKGQTFLHFSGLVSDVGELTGYFRQMTTIKQNNKTRWCFLTMMV